MATTADCLRLDVLNCTDGDAKLVFDPDDADDSKRALEIMQDMMRRGYSIFVETEGGKAKRAEGYDPKTQEFIISTTAESQPPAAKLAEVAVHASGRPKKTRIPAKGARATAVAMTSGG